MYKKIIPLLLIPVLILASSTLHAREAIKCASTTSTYNSGLLDYLVPLFTKETGIDVDVVAVGSGEALELGQKGEVDVVLTHAANLEKQMVGEGFFIDREEIMYNDFIIVGPDSDPAGIKKTQKVIDAFQKIRTAEAKFISRSDNSGTNMRENRLWAMTGTMPGRKNPWYLAEGQSMADTIRNASKQRAYTLSDRATWLSINDKDKSGLQIVLEGDPELLNQYGVMIVNPANFDHINYQSAMNFVIWLTSPAGQAAIGAFKDSSGNTLFTPNAR